MIPGGQPMASIETEIRREREAVDDLDGRAAASNARLLQVGAAQAAAYRELARLRVDLLASDVAADRLAAGLDAAERQVAELLRQREATATALAGAVNAAEQRRSALQAARGAQVDTLASADDAVDAAEARTQARLEADERYRAQRERTERADGMATQAEEKATLSEQEQDEKGRTYREDPLFSYLWRRRYGTSAYRALPPFRWLDGKVARHAGFLSARADYARLLEIPKRLREHATTVRGRAEAEVAALRELDDGARTADGIPALASAREAAAATLQALDGQLEGVAVEIRKLLDERQALAAGQDAPYKQAIDALVASLRTEQLVHLRDEALATPTAEDDATIGTLLELHDEQHRLESSAKELTDALQGHRQRLRELEGLQLEYRRRQYDVPGHGFQDGVLVATVVANVLSGMLSRDALWRVLEQQRRVPRPSAKPTFGSGAFGKGSPWGGGNGPKPGGGHGGASGGGFGGGGFRSGGTMRGGGFRSGGRF